MQRKTIDAPARLPLGRRPQDPDEWLAEIQVANAAIAVLLARVQATRQADYQREQALWRHHYETLWRMKRSMDAVVM